MTQIVEFTRLHPDAKMFRNAYGNDAGYDLFSIEDMFIPWGEWRDVPCGVAIAVPDGFYARIVNRSSALRKRRLLVIEGIVDAGYRGEQFTCAWAIPPQENKRSYPHPNGVMVWKGESIAQIVIQQFEQVEWKEVGVLRDSDRGTRGFGSSDAIRNDGIRPNTGKRSS